MNDFLMIELTQFASPNLSICFNFNLLGFGVIHMDILKLTSRAQYIYREVYHTHSKMDCMKKYE